MRTKIENQLLILHFEGNRTKMNQVLDILSNAYEGIIHNREGHNFPSSFITKSHILYRYKDQCKYVIGVYNGKSITHELLHVQYFIDPEYKDKILQEWSDMEPHKRNYITSFLKRLGYSDSVIIDEYQAYRYSEAPNFFGIKL
jgi:hypothetical protein